jgi:molybdopterin-binding protein
MSSEAVRELGLEVGTVAVAVVKATTVIIETAEPKARS